jgi:hypothetical protein
MSDDCVRTEDEVFIVLARHGQNDEVVIGVFSRPDLVQSAMRGYIDDVSRINSEPVDRFTVHPASFNQHGLAPATEYWLVKDGIPCRKYDLTPAERHALARIRAGMDPTRGLIPQLTDRGLITQRFGTFGKLELTDIGNKALDAHPKTKEIEETFRKAGLK